ncbi:hypothetical protein QR680_014168 [Steinernema hermaphroditum]|uniref:GHMP kinase C-terminal domain-containing protein n=1 Tax=Steinernema hermaphroditum TaxID=289476 RepID=A0AA39M3F5_9BILA|nr:hypothetical protein QR680_014168 [Steinernema hermaphroditum]
MVMGPTTGSVDTASSVGDSSSAASSSSLMNNHNHASSSASSVVTASPMRSLTSAHGGLYVSAPGKIILFGEHAVVQGKTAIAGSIDLRTYVSLFTSADGRIYLSMPDLGVEKTWMLKDLVKALDRINAECPIDGLLPPSLESGYTWAQKLANLAQDQPKTEKAGAAAGATEKAIYAFWYLLIGVMQRKSAQLKQNAHGMAPTERAMFIDKALRDLMAVKMTVRFKLPSCVGLGSSGAFCVCIASALLQTAGIIPPPSVPADEKGCLKWDDCHLEVIRNWSAAAEAIIHNRASGLDASICTFGGIASYRQGHPIEQLHNVPDLKVILVNSKVERSTWRMVSTVRERQKAFPSVIDGIFNTIDSIAREAIRVLTKPMIEENGDVQENGGRSQNTTPLPLDENEHHNLQPIAYHHHHHSGSVRSASLASYSAGGKRGSTASALSGVSGHDGGHGSDRGSFNDTYTQLNELCRICNEMLRALGVGHAKIDQICTLLARYGIHPKMTGAGGGGSVFAFLKPDTASTVVSMIEAELKKQGYEMWQPALGGPGVMWHSERPELFSASSKSVTPCGSHQSTPATRHNAK